MMTLSRRAFLPLLALVAGLQTAALAYIVVGRDRLLKTGREMIVQVIPVDPRDIFRGDYVTLGYPMSVIAYPASKFGALPEGVRRGCEIFVTLAPGEGDSWSVQKISTGYPTEAGAGEVVLKGRVGQVSGKPDNDETTVAVRYGIESYFVPEGTGKPLEEKVREKSIRAVLAVGGDGTAAIKGLIVDGERRLDPPIF